MSLLRAALIGLVLTGCASGPGTVGAVFGRDEETRALHVREAPPGLGAGRAGLLPGDEVVMIDGLYVKDMNAQQIRARLRGEVGTAVHLTVLRGPDVLHVRVERAPPGQRRAPPPAEERIAE